jgi:hypothetical protein
MIYKLIVKHKINYYAKKTPQNNKVMVKKSLEAFKKSLEACK